MKTQPGARHVVRKRRCPFWSVSPEASDEPVVLDCVHGIAQRCAVYHVRQLFLPSIA